MGGRGSNGPKSPLGRHACLYQRPMQHARVILQKLANHTFGHIFLELTGGTKPGTVKEGSKE